MFQKINNAKQASKTELKKAQMIFQLSNKEISKFKWHTMETNEVFMEKGTHEFKIKYSTGYDYNYYEIYSGTDMNVNGKKGVIYKAGRLSATKDRNENTAYATETIKCSLPQDADSLRIKIVYQNSMDIYDVFIRAQHDLDKIWYFIFMAVILIMLYYLTMVKYAGKENKSTRIVIWVLVWLCVYVSIPLMNSFMLITDDLTYHLTRVSGIYESIRDGQFPVFVNQKQMFKYGYASSIMYPHLFLFIPVILRFLGMSLLNAYKVFLCMINTAGVLIAYYSFKKIFSSRRTTLVSSSAFILSLYFILNQYHRGALGEAIAMIFLPLLFLGLYEVYFRDFHKWPILVIAVTGILESHVISVFIYGCIALVALVAAFPHMIKKHELLKRIGALFKAAAVALCLNAFFLIPFITYYREPLNATTNTFADGISEFMNSAVYVSQMFLSVFSDASVTKLIGNVGIGSTANEMPLSVGFASLIIMAAFASVYVSKKEELSKKGKNKTILNIGLVSFTASLILLYMASNQFPWMTVLKLPIIKNFVSIQFLCRLLAPATLFLAVLAGCVTELTVGLGWPVFAAERRNLVSKLFCAVMIGLMSLNSFVLIQKSSNLDTFASKVDINSQNFTDDLYLYYGTSADEINARGEYITSSVNNVKIYNCRRKGLTITFDYTLPHNVTRASFTLPLNYYYNYYASVNGEKVEAYGNAEHFVQIDVDSNSGTATVYYRAPALFILGYFISGMSLAIVILGIVLKRILQKRKPSLSNKR